MQVSNKILNAPKLLRPSQICLHFSFAIPTNFTFHGDTLTGSDDLLHFIDESSLGEWCEHVNYEYKIKQKL